MKKHQMKADKKWIDSGWVIQLIQELNGTQLAVDYTALFGFRYSF